MDRKELLNKIYEELDIAPEFHNPNILDLKMSLKDIDKIVDIIYEDLDVIK